MCWLTRLFLPFLDSSASINSKNALSHHQIRPIAISTHIQIEQRRDLSRVPHAPQRPRQPLPFLPSQHPCVCGVSISTSIYLLAPQIQFFVPVDLSTSHSPTPWALSLQADCSWNLGLLGDDAYRTTKLTRATSLSSSLCWCGRRRKGEGGRDVRIGGGFV